MSKNFFKELKNSKNKVSLSKSEQNLGRNKLENFIQKNSVIKNNQTSHNNQKATNFLKFNSLTTNFMSNFKLSYLVIPVILVMGAGISFAAENSLPGDFLYPVKIHVNEPVESALSISPKSKADLNSHLAQKRLQEAEQLLSQGKLSPQIEEQLTSNFKTHSESFDKEVAKLKEQNDTKDADQAESDFKDNLKSHKDIMGDLGLEEALKQDSNKSSTATNQLDNLKTDFENGKTTETNQDSENKLKSEDQKMHSTSDATNSHKSEVNKLKSDQAENIETRENSASDTSTTVESKDTNSKVEKANTEIETITPEVENKTSETQLQSDTSVPNVGISIPLSK